MASSGSDGEGPKRFPLRGWRDEGAEQATAEDAVVDMAEILSCPREVRGDHIRRLAHAMSDVDLGHDLAMLAARVHPDAPVAPVLAEIAATYQRHFREYEALLDRLVVLEDPCAAHAHVTLDDDALRAMMATMFKTSRGAEADDKERS